ncbi:MAG: dTDP-4-amino-4,6-dideoxygalactose transaminase [Bacteroidetes bacterium 4572_128]|nr:MAG: dTDP-4-amino-4,6-dideoxygalactose transaminase [Bacteroidetes bacterium 4572_128]
MIKFNKPYLTGKEAHYIFQAVYDNNHISGNGNFTKKCHDFFENRYGFKKTLMTTSCTDALEMAAILINIKEGDEVIMPSFTFVSTANAFVLRGAKIIFADSEKDTPNIDADKIENLITKKTKAIVPVHYAGMSCDMDKIMSIAKKHNIFVIEDAAQAINSYYKNKPLGSIGHFGTFSFHETKNIQAGEGGLLIINDEKFIKRAEIIWEKGTNRAEFFRGDVDKYGWVDIGSSFLPSDMIAAFLYAQLENLDKIQKKRKVPYYASNNAHMFYIICNNFNDRTKILKHFKENNIMAVFHYLSLHKSQFYKNKYDGDSLFMADFYEENLIRLPLFYELDDKKINKIVEILKKFFQKK